MQNIITSMLYLFADIILFLWAGYLLGSKSTQRKILRLREEAYNIVYTLLRNLNQRVSKNHSKKPAIKEPTSKVLSLEEYKELEKKDFDKRLRIVLRNKNIVDTEFEDIEDVEDRDRQNTTKYYSR